MKFRVLLQVLPAALLALTGCASSQSSTREDTTTGQQAMTAQGAACPMRVSGTKVEAASTEQGAALTFTTTGDVAELRKRVAAMAEMHNTRHMGAKAAACEKCAQGAHESCPKCAQKEGAQAGCKCAQASCPKCEASCTQCAQGHQEGASCQCDHKEGAQASCPKCAQGQQACAHCAKGMKAPAARATVEEIEGGARLVLTPEDPAQADALRAHVQRHAEMMNSGKCPMMQAHSEAH